MDKLEILRAKVPRHPPVDDDFIESLSSLTINDMVTLTYS
jgi:hypothetical protein